MNFDEMLKSLQQDYLASIPAKIADLEQCLANSDTNALREAFHKLKGTGKTYGLPEISDLGAAVEKICIERPHAAISAATLAVALMQEIHRARISQAIFQLETDARMQQLLKL